MNNQTSQPIAIIQAAIDLRYYYENVFWVQVPGKATGKNKKREFFPQHPVTIANMSKVIAESAHWLNF